MRNKRLVGSKINTEKSFFARYELEYLGFKTRILLPDKVEAIRTYWCLQSNITKKLLLIKEWVGNTALNFFNSFNKYDFLPGKIRLNNIKRYLI